MAYKKPQIVAKSAAQRSFVAGCPAKGGSNNSTATCSYCERTR